MKKSFYILALFLISILLFTSCEPEVLMESNENSTHNKLDSIEFDDTIFNTGNKGPLDTGDQGNPIDEGRDDDE